MKLKDQVAVVTGSAQGIGRSVAEALAKEGAAVVISDINIELAEKTASEIKQKFGVETLAVAGNVAKYEDCENLMHGELIQKIEEALAELPDNQRSAILLCRQEDLSYEEIADVLDCSLSATKSLIHRGRETLKEKLKHYLQTGEWSD